MRFFVAAGPVAGWILLAVGVFFIVPHATPWVSAGVLLLISWRQREYRKLQQDSRLRQEALSHQRVSFTGDLRRSEGQIRNLEEGIHKISEPFVLSKQFLATLDLKEVLRITAEALEQWFPLTGAQKRQRMLQEVSSLAEGKEISAEAFLKLLPADSGDASSRERWGIVSGQLALGFRRATLYGQVQEAALHDGLTGLLVRRHFLERLEEEVVRARRRESSIAFLMVDIDHFKGINDTHGHLVGDVVLREVARLIQRSVREMDLVGRYGGEEFSVLLPEAGFELGIQIADRIRERIEHSAISAYDVEIHTTVSVGVAFSRGLEISVEQLIEQADGALYQAKEMGRNRTVAA